MTLESMRSITCPALVAPLLLVALCSEAARIDGDPSYHYDRFEVRSIITTVSEPRPNDVFGNLTKLELAHDQRSFYVLDYGWRVAVDSGYRQVTEIKPLGIPEGIVKFVRSIESPAPGMTLMAVSGMRAVGARLWVGTPGLGADLLAFSVPDSVGDRVDLVYPGVLTEWWVRDAIVLRDRVIAITGTEIHIASVEPLDG